MTNDLDTRARASARAVHDAVRDLPVPTVSPTRPPHRARVVLVAAAAIVVVALTVSLIGGDDDDARVSSDPSGAAPRLVADPPPAGMAASGATDLPGGEPVGSGTDWVDWDAGAEAPFEAADLAVVELTLDGFDLLLDGARSTEVDGRPAWVSPPSDDAAGQHSVFLELEGSTLGLISASLDDDELLAVAGQLDLDADDLEPPASIVGLDQIGTVTGAIDLSTMLPFPIGAGHQVADPSDGASDGSEGIAVVSLEGGDDLLAVARWSLGATERPVEVRGIDGWLGSPSGQATPLVVWQESPTAVIVLVGYGVDDAALLATADSLRVANDAEWAALLAQAGAVSVPSDARVGVSGGGEPGSRFAAYLDAQGDLCVSYDDTDGSIGICSGSSEAAPLTVSTQRLGSGEIVVYGYTTIGTEGELRIEGDDGSPVGSEAYHDEGTFFAGVFSDTDLPAEVIVRTSDGTELARTAVVAPGEDSGSFSGQGTPITEP